jgi:hypothetical protein
MHIVAIEAANLPMIHVALDEIVALHSILVGRQVGELIKVGRAVLELLQLPVVCPPLPRNKTDRPVVIPALDRIR